MHIFKGVGLIGSVYVFALFFSFIPFIFICVRNELRGETANQSIDLQTMATSKKLTIEWQILV